ncbi:ANTAR domain-containing response regulator [Mesobacillus zeae]|uniref:Response regulator n=1 Tax=Mesobacillus zeae TaxID=1917180 RepID=A0A398BFJ9_9BACI|nr:response regulator [Mesobacillus zeae]RID86333.1 response regulator [Mesobacillus zeae]
MRKRIVIVDDEPITRMDIRELLSEAGYDVVGEASDGFEAIDVCRKFTPDLVIMDIKMPILDGLKASKMIMREKLASSILLLSAFNDRDYIQQAKEVGALGYLVKPLDEKSFIPTVEVAIARGHEIHKLEHDFENVSQKLDDRKTIDIAKGLLMKEKSIVEDEAYNLLRKLSMDRRCSMGQIAREIVIMYE